MSPEMTTEEMLARITEQLYGKTPEELTREEIDDLLGKLDRIISEGKSIHETP